MDDATKHHDYVAAFEAAGQGYTTVTTSFGSTLAYEETATGSGKRQRVLVDGSWVYCPSDGLMYPQETIDGFKRGSKATWHGVPCTVLSVYRSGLYKRVTVMRSNRRIDTDREGLCTSDLVLVAS